MNRVRSALAAGLLFASTAAIAAAQEGAPGMLRDVVQPPHAQRPAFWLGSLHFVELGDALYFNAWEPSEGEELWRSDGTAAGTHLVRDICPGACPGRRAYEMVESGGILYFHGDDGEHGGELWRSDGTAAGTWMVTDIAPGPRGSFPSFFTAAPGGVYFVANDRSHGVELWWSDGTTGGTRMVVDLFPADPQGSSNDGPSHLVMLGTTLLFAADDGAHGRELWRTDGTAAGTSLLLDALPGPGSGLNGYQPFPRSYLNPVAAGDKVFFSAAGSGTPTPVPWVSDGTPEGTIQLAEPVPGGREPTSFFAFGDVVLFAGGPDRRLSRSDGTPEGTYSLATLANGMPLVGWSFAQLGDRAYFSAGDALLTQGPELWSTDGTEDGTFLVKDIRAGAEGSLTWTLVLEPLADRLYFFADDGVHGGELWSSDGTSEGTGLVQDFLPGPGAAYPAPFFPTLPRALGDRLLFQASDETAFVLCSLTSGAAAIKRLRSTADRPGSPRHCLLDEPCPLVDEIPSGVGFIVAEDHFTGEPWISDGHPSGTRQLADLRPGPEGSMAGGFRNAFAMVDDIVVVLADAWDPAQVYAVADGITPLTAGFEANGANKLVPWNGAAYFATQGGLFRTDGTVEGTQQLAGGACTGEIVGGPETLFFVNFDRLWATDGTVDGTRRVAPSLDLRVALLAVTAVDGQDRLFFSAADAAGGSELWITDGTDAGTRQVIDLRPGASGSIPKDPSQFNERNRILIATGGRAYFVADDGAGGEELWVSDGSPGNASVLYAWPGAGSSKPRWLAAVGDRVYFVADDGVHGREPWVTEGTQATTRLLADLRPGPGSSAARELTPWGDRVVFAADDGVHGMELWRTGVSDLDADPPVMHELRNGPRPSSPMGFTVSNGRLFFFADDGVHGLEPWAWPIGGRFFEDGFESGDTAAWEWVK